MAVTEIWHNPRCSKSRQTLALLDARGIAPKIRLYQADAPSEAEIRAALAALGRPAIDLVRSGDALFRDLGLTKDTGEDELIAAMAAHPALIERPLVLHDGRAALGRPPEAVLDLF
ncbi:arsenate reductase (glutaredoxin) [Defluviimonas sp. D31]|uniref:arsenate reductase (glutaredoxin) n=1 Tax=Defluviimonas sp. D31 TaxID=3083253 RepID=UPI00296FDA45|nr:arsenate reductase (glutaredoxin) [Defluviimonas sp. D31]MDW4550392.1 arsenate reductase (glutaredoxin) [Defluviimonas sp. D31]